MSFRSGCRRIMIKTMAALIMGGGRKWKHWQWSTEPYRSGICHFYIHGKMALYPAATQAGSHTLWEKQQLRQESHPWSRNQLCNQIQNGNRWLYHCRDRYSWTVAVGPLFQKTLDHIKSSQILDHRHLFHPLRMRPRRRQMLEWTQLEWGWRVEPQRQGRSCDHRESIEVVYCFPLEGILEYQLCQVAG